MALRFFVSSQKITIYEVDFRTERDAEAVALLIIRVPEISKVFAQQGSKYS